MNDQELNRLVAERIDGWTKVVPGNVQNWQLFGEKDGGWGRCMIPDYCNDANETLRLLGKGRNWDAHFFGKNQGELSYRVMVHTSAIECQQGWGSTFPKAAVLALLKAHGVEVEG